jgi:hypothetical protein
MYATGRFTITEVARRFGVSYPTIRRVVDPEWGARYDAAARDRIYAMYRQPCIDGCGQTAWTINGPGRCPACTSKRRMTDQHGTDAVYRRGCRCDVCRDQSAARKREWRRRQVAA